MMELKLIIGLSLTLYVQILVESVPFNWREIFCLDICKCGTEGCIKVSRLIEANIDPKVNPCEDFYEFACGGAIKDGPDGIIRHHLDLFSEAAYQVINSIQDLLLNNEIDPSDSEVMGKLRIFYSSCLGGATREEVTTLLGDLGGLPLLNSQASQADWIDTYGILYEKVLKLSPFFELTDTVSRNGYEIIRINKIETNSWKEEKRIQEIEHYINLLKIVQPDEFINQSIRNQLEEMFSFRVELDRIYSNSDERLIFKAKLMDMEVKLQQIDWRRLFTKMTKIRIDSDTKVLSIDAVKQVANLISNTPSAVVINHILVTALEKLEPEVARGADRSGECVRLVRSKFSHAINRIYLRHFLKPEKVAHARKMIDLLQRQLLASIQQASWISQEGKLEARRKVEEMRVVIGHPRNYLNHRVDERFEELHFYPDKFLHNYLESTKFQVESSENHKSIETDVFLDSSRPYYVNMAQFGAVIGHELGHAFDPSWAIYAAQRDQPPIQWDSETRQEYAKRARCLLQQIDEVGTEEFGFKVDGRKVLNEILADNVGLTIAHLAYENWTRQNGREKLLPNLSFSRDQLFWLSYASIWCEQRSLEQIADEFKDDPHPPHKLRVNLPLSNSAEFARDFKCPLGSNMNPFRKCRPFAP